MEMDPCYHHQCFSNNTKRKSSLYKPNSEDIKILKDALSAFLKLQKDEEVHFSLTPLIWERLSIGCRIIDFLPNKTEEVQNLLETLYFCPGELCGELALHIDSITVKIYQQFIFDLIKDYNSFCALEEGTGKVIGVALATCRFLSNITSEESDVIQQDMFNLINVASVLLERANIYEYYNVDRYFCIHTLCVRPDYCGKGIGTSLIRACLSKAQKLGLPACVGIFRAGATQTVAQRLGFEDLSELPFVTLKNSKKHLEYLTCMGILLPLIECDELEGEEFDENNYIDNVK